MNSVSSKQSKCIFQALITLPSGFSLFISFNYASNYRKVRIFKAYTTWIIAIRCGLRDWRLVLYSKSDLVYKTGKLEGGFYYYEKIHYSVKIALLNDGRMEQTVN